MRAAPAVRVRVTRFGVWRAAIAAVLAVGWAAIGGWIASHVFAQGWPAAAPAAGVGGLAVLLSGGLASRLARVEPFDLRWDGQCWFLAHGGSTGTDPVAGDLRVAIDLGTWLLLRFLPDPSVAAAAPRWLPVQRRGGLAGEWHGLRCAAYSPRPAPAKPAGSPTG